jgi:hypothetical protein
VLADYTDQLVQHYKIDSLDTHAYLNRAALVGCKNQAHPLVFGLIVKITNQDGFLVKTPKYFKVIFMTDENNQKHYGILVERIHDTMITKPGWLPVPEERVTYKTLSDIQNFILVKFF